MSSVGKTDNKDLRDLPCPMGGKHQLTPGWRAKPFGTSCFKCHKTWTFTAEGVRPQYPDLPSATS